MQLAASALFAVLASAAAASAAKPHIFLVLVDDYGYNNIGYHARQQPNADEIVTPNSA